MANVFGVGDLDWGVLSKSVGPRIRLLRNNLNARSIAASEPFGLPTGSLTIMSLIARNPGSSQKELADKAGITGPGLVSLVDELEKRELVRRDRSTADRRRNMLVLTDKGEETVEELFKVVSQIEAPIREELSPQELEQLIGLIDRALKALGEG